MYVNDGPIPPPTVATDDAAASVVTFPVARFTATGPTDCDGDGPPVPHRRSTVNDHGPEHVGYPGNVDPIVAIVHQYVTPSDNTPSGTVNDDWFCTQFEDHTAEFAPQLLPGSTPSCCGRAANTTARYNGGFWFTSGSTTVPVLNTGDADGTRPPSAGATNAAGGDAWSHTTSNVGDKLLNVYTPAQPSNDTPSTPPGSFAATHGRIMFVTEPPWV